MSLKRIKAGVVSLFVSKDGTTQLEHEPSKVEREPPREIQLWNAGDNPTDYGVHKWTTRAAAAVMADYERRGNPLTIDVEHIGVTTADGKPAPIGGYAKLELRAGAPWLHFEWSDYGAEQIRSGQRRFLSPDYLVDKATGEIVQLTRVSLVAAPGTHHARVLASATPKENSMGLAMILAALTAALAAEDPAVCKESVSALVAELKKSAGGDGADPEAAAEGVEAAGDAQEQPAGTEATAAAADDTDEKKGPPEQVAAKAKVKASASSTPALTDATKAIGAAAAVAVAQVQASTRDHLIATQGERLAPSLRRWAASQPLEIVQGLLGALPAETEKIAASRVTPTRGEGQGAGAQTAAASAEVEEIRAAMGRAPSKAPEIINTEDALVLPTITPTQFRERERIAAAAAAGKDTK